MRFLQLSISSNICKPLIHGLITLSPMAISFRFIWRASHVSKHKTLAVFEYNRGLLKVGRITFQRTKSPYFRPNVEDLSCEPYLGGDSTYRYCSLPKDLPLRHEN